MHYLRDLTVLILGLGDSGLAMARWCARCGAHVRVADTRAHPPQAATLAADVPTASLHKGLDVALLDGVNLVLKSPGLMPNDPAVAALTARNTDVPIWTNCPSCPKSAHIKVKWCRSPSPRIARIRAPSSIRTF